MLKGALLAASALAAPAHVCPAGQYYAEYATRSAGFCSEVGYSYVWGRSQCGAAASALHLGVNVAVDDGNTRVSYDPTGCYYEYPTLKFNPRNNTGRCTVRDTCLCRKVGPAARREEGVCPTPLASAAECTALAAAYGGSAILPPGSPAAASVISSGAAPPGCTLRPYSSSSSSSSSSSTLEFNNQTNSSAPCSRARPCFCATRCALCPAGTFAAGAGARTACSGTPCLAGHDGPAGATSRANATCALASVRRRRTYYNRRRYSSQRRRRTYYNRRRRRRRAYSYVGASAASRRRAPHAPWPGEQQRLQAAQEERWAVRFGLGFVFALVASVVGSLLLCNRCACADSRACAKASLSLQPVGVLVMSLLLASAPSDDSSRPPAQRTDFTDVMWLGALQIAWLLGNCAGLWRQLTAAGGLHRRRASVAPQLPPGLMQQMTTQVGGGGGRHHQVAPATVVMGQQLSVVGVAGGMGGGIAGQGGAAGGAMAAVKGEGGAGGTRVSGLPVAVSVALPAGQQVQQFHQVYASAALPAATVSTTMVAQRPTAADSLTV